RAAGQRRGRHRERGRGPAGRLRRGGRRAHLPPGARHGRPRPPAARRRRGGTGAALSRRPGGGGRAAAPAQAMSRKTSPVGGLGWKKVVFGGIRSPPWAVASIWAIVAGRSSTPS